MGKHSTKGQIVLKRDRKLEVVYRAVPPQSAIEEHMAKFKELYPADWESLVYRYQEYERHTPKGKSHPMPEPTQYLMHKAPCGRTLGTSTLASGAGPLGA